MRLTGAKWRIARDAALIGCLLLLVLPAAHASASSIRVLSIGDSITFDTNTEILYTDVVQDLLGEGFDVVNKGIPGMDVVHLVQGGLPLGMDESIWDLSVVQAAPFDIVTLMLGTNCALGFNTGGTCDPTTWHDTMEQILFDLSTYSAFDGSPVDIILMPAPIMDYDRFGIFIERQPIIDAMEAYRDSVFELCGQFVNARCPFDLYEQTAVLGMEFMFGCTFAPDYDPIHPCEAFHTEILGPQLAAEIVQTVPEPSTKLLFGGGVVLLAWARRRGLESASHRVADDGHNQPLSNAATRTGRESTSAQ